jgi:hypothetical protein
MAAEASEPELSGIGAGKNTRADPSQTDGRAGRCTRVGDAPRPRLSEASTATTPNILFYLVACRSTRPRGGRLPSASAPQLRETAYPDYPYIKVCKPEG